MIFRRKDKQATTDGSDASPDSPTTTDADETTSHHGGSRRPYIRHLLVRLIRWLSVAIFMGCTSFLFRTYWRQQILIDEDQYYPRLHAAPIHTISDASWKQMMDKFQESLYNPDADPDVWFPFVLQGRKILCRKEHAIIFKGNERFFNLVEALEYALRYAVQRKSINKITTENYLLAATTSLSSTSIHLPLPKRKSIPLIFFMGDGKHCFNRVFPRFGWSTPWDGQPCHVFAVPCYTIFGSRPDRTPKHNYFHNEMEKAYPWADKKRQAVWRGVATGVPANRDWFTLPRAQLVNYSIYYPDLLDAALVDTTQFLSMFPDEEPKLRNFSRFAERIEMEQYQKYRAVVDIDGNSWSARFGQILCMNSVVIKVYPKNKNYFFDELKPWKHYIPVKNDMSDLMDAIRFAVSKENEEKVRSIIYNANEFCRTRLTRRRMAMDTFWMINQYIQMLGNNATRWRQWDSLWASYQKNVTMVAATSFKK